MRISYDKLWKLLIDKKMSKADLRKAVEMSPNTLTKMRKEEEVSMGVLLKIAKYIPPAQIFARLIYATPQKITADMTVKKVLFCKFLLINRGIPARSGINCIKCKQISLFFQSI